MKHLTDKQRYTISVMNKLGYKQSEIAIAVEKDKSTISRELKRNCDKRSGKYDWQLAQRKYETRQEQKPKHIRFTDEVKELVNSWIAEDYSPEQISGRAKLEGKKCVSHERIYQYIWEDKKHKGELYKHLRRNGRHYRKRGNMKDSRGLIKNRVSIDERPEIVDKKERFGDFEIDTIIGKNHKGAILTINDRWSSIVWIQKLTGKQAVPLSEKTIETIMPFKILVHTITGDNGKEFAGHESIANELSLNFYFAHPYHSWERGANENTNGLIRQYVPKGTDFENITQKQLNYVQHKLNNRPRKRLGFLSPIEFFNKFVKSKHKQKVAFAA